MSLNWKRFSVQADLELHLGLAEELARQVEEMADVNIGLNAPVNREEVNPAAGDNPREQAERAEGEAVEADVVPKNEEKKDVEEEEIPFLTPNGSETKGLSCIICYEAYNTEKRIPKVFPCGHTVCGSCVGSLSKSRSFLSSSTIHCPTCRQNSRYTSADKVPTNFSILAMLEQRKEEHGTTKKGREELNCFECKNSFVCTEVTLCGDEKCQSQQAPDTEPDVDSIKRPKCLLICRTCITTNHTRHNFTPFEKVAAQYEANRKIISVETDLRKSLREADKTLKLLDRTKREVIDHKQRMLNAIENIRDDADHPEIYEYLKRFKTSAEASGKLFNSFQITLGEFDTKSKARYYRSFGPDMLRPITAAPTKSDGTAQVKKEPGTENTRYARRQQARQPNPPPDRDRRLLNFFRDNVHGGAPDPGARVRNEGAAGGQHFMNLNNMVGRVLDQLEDNVEQVDRIIAIDADNVGLEAELAAVRQAVMNNPLFAGRGDAGAAIPAGDDGLRPGMLDIPFAGFMELDDVLAVGLPPRPVPVVAPAPAAAPVRADQPAQAPVPPPLAAARAAVAAAAAEVRAAENALGANANVPGADADRVEPPVNARNANAEGAPNEAALPAFVDGGFRNRLNVWAVRGPILPRRFRRPPNNNGRALRDIRHDLQDALIANPVLADIPAVQNAIDDLRDLARRDGGWNNDMFDLLNPRRPDEFALGIQRAEEDMNRLRQQIQQLDARIQPNIRRRNRVGEAIAAVAGAVAAGVPGAPGVARGNQDGPPIRWVDRVVDEPLPRLPLIEGVDHEMVQRAEIAELILRIRNMVRNEAEAEAVANGVAVPRPIPMPPLLNGDRIPGMPDFNNLRPQQVAPFLDDLRALELEWIQRGRDRRARAVPQVAAAPEEEVAAQGMIEQPEEIPQNDAAVPEVPQQVEERPQEGIVENVVNQEREVRRRVPSPIPDEPAAKRDRR